MTHGIERGQYVITMADGTTVEAEVEYVSPKDGRVVVRLPYPWAPRYDIAGRNVNNYKWELISDM